MLSGSIIDSDNLTNNLFNPSIQMETKETDKIVVSKPVASRPSSSIIRSFPDLAAGAIRGSDPTGGPELGSSPIKPKTIRFKPAINDAPPPAVSCEGDAQRSVIRPTILYKPLAKVVSQTALSLLANMGQFEPSDRKANPSVRANDDSITHQIGKTCSSRSQLSSNVHEHLRDLPNSSLPVEDSRDLPPTGSGDRVSYDGYNWRKYGQKQVKGSEYPRSYYKCTHSNCPVKKKVERSLDGKIAEIVYKGEHNHPKPQPPKRGLVTGQDTSDPLVGSRIIERKEGCEGKAEAANDINPKGSLVNGCVVDRGLPAAGLNLNGLSAEQEDGTTRMGMDPDEPRSKRRKTKNQQSGVQINSESPQEPQVSVQGSVDPEILDDGFRWRKYGQKVVKGNPYPRNYYKCTGFECNVRKHVERALDCPTLFVTTYEGKHNHEMPLRSMNQPSSESTPRASTSKERTTV